MIGHWLTPLLRQKCPIYLIRCMINATIFWFFCNARASLTHYCLIHQLNCLPFNHSHSHSHQKIQTVRWFWKRFFFFKSRKGKKKLSQAHGELRIPPEAFHTPVIGCTSTGRQTRDAEIPPILSFSPPQAGCSKAEANNQKAFARGSETVGWLIGGWKFRSAARSHSHMSINSNLKINSKTDWEPMKWC